MSNVGSAFSGLTSLLRGAAQPQPTAQPTHATVKPSAVDVLVRTQPEKYGRAIAPEIFPNALERPAAKALSSQAAAAAVVEKPAKEKIPVTLDAIVKEYGRTERWTTKRALLQGMMVHAWLVQQPDRAAAEQLDRASALKMIARAILAARSDRRTCRPDRDLRCYHVAKLLGNGDSEQAESVSIAAIREMVPLMTRDKKAVDRWALTAEYAEAAKALWARILADKLSGDAVRQEVHKILPRKSLSLRKHRPVKIAYILRLAPRIRPEDFPTLIARLQELQHKTLLPEEKVA